MPPKFKFSREQIVAVALYLVRKGGLAAVTARAIGEELCSSPKVIFSLFRDMGELRNEVISEAKAVYKSYVEEGLKQTPPFKGVGMSYIKFASEEPQLFRLLFMSENGSVPRLEDVLNIIENSYEAIIGSIETSYGFSRETAAELYRHLWIYSHGIAALTATKVCIFTADEISRMLTEVFKGIMIEYKSEGKI